MLKQDALTGRPREGRLPCHHLIEDAGHGILVGTAIDHGAGGLFRTHVRGRADRGHGSRLRGRRRIQAAGDSEIEHHRVPSGQHDDVLRLDVPVDQSLIVGVAQRTGHLPRDPHGVLDRELSLPVEPTAKGFSSQERHHIIEEAVGFARIEERHDVRVDKTGGHFDLGAEAGGPDRGSQLGIQNLDRHRPAVLHITGFEDRAHSTASQLANCVVTTRKCRLQPSQDFGRHGQRNLLRKALCTSTGSHHSGVASNLVFGHHATMPKETDQKTESEAHQNSWNAYALKLTGLLSRFPWMLPSLCTVILAWSVLGWPFLWDDFDFLGRVRNLRLTDLLPDPSIVFYRPISREIYFWVVDHVLFASPLAAHILNAGIICAIIALLMSFVRTLSGERPALLSGILLACSASLPLVIGWASAGQDLLSALFIVVSLQLQLRRRVILAALALAAAMLSKETGIAGVPAVALLAVVRTDRSRREITRTLLVSAIVVLAWVAVQPWTRSVLLGADPASPSMHRYLIRDVPILPALVQGVLITANFPWIVQPPTWPSHLLFPTLIVSALIYLLLTPSSPIVPSLSSKSNSRTVIVVGLAMFAVSIAITSVALGGWSPHYVCIPAIGLSMMAGPVLARASRIGVILATVVYLWLGIGLRGNPIDPIVPTEPNFGETARAMRKVERGFKALRPTLPAGSNVYVSVQAQQSGGIYRHLYRFQPLRVWYREENLWVLDPNRRKEKLPHEFLFWIDRNLSVYEINLADLAPRGPTDKISLPQYQKTLRGYALGVAGAGDPYRAAFILGNMPQTSRQVWAFDLRTAVALLLAAKRAEDAQSLAAKAPKFTHSEALQAVVALVAEPVSGLDLDIASMRAFGLDSNDPSNVRSIMHRLEASGYNLAAGRFARRLQSLVPGDRESAAVLRRTAEPPSQAITVPIPYDVPQ
jgi:hypothetical protein